MLKDILTYWSIIRKRLWLTLVLFVSTIGTIIGSSYLAPPVYMATVRFEVTAPPPVDVTLFTGFGNYDPGEEILRTRDRFIDVLTSRAVAQQVIETLQLSMDSEELQSLIVIEEVVLPQVQSKPQQSERQLMKVGVQSRDREIAADLTNTLINAALQRYGEIRARSKTMSREFIVSQLEATGQELNQAQEALITFQIENTIGDLRQAIALQQELIYDLHKNRDLAQAQGRLNEVAGFNQLILEREVELQDLVRLELEYANLEAGVEQAKSTYEFLLAKQAEAALKENEILNLGFIQIIGPATTPSSPLPRVKTSILALGSVLSLVIGIMVVFIWNYFEMVPTESVESVEGANLTTVSAS